MSKTVFTEEHKRKISIANTGKKRPYAVNNLPKDVRGKKNPFYGKKHSDETKNMLREKRKAQIISKESYKKAADKRHEFYYQQRPTIICSICGKEKKVKPSKINITKYCSRGCRSKGVSLQFKGKTKSKEHKKKIGLGNVGRKCANPYGRGKSGIREDLGTFFRSTWEANFARILNYLGIEWEYEPQDKRIIFETCSYLPDFYLPEKSLYIELKGSRFGERDKKLGMLYKEQPEFPIKIIDKEVYSKLTKMFKDKIKNWE
jgi:hypothetical protein